jgi:SNF2 family DNA or RNA helicase
LQKGGKPLIQVRRQYGNIYVRILDTMETFEYTLNKIRAIPGRSFKIDTGEWMFPKESIGELLQQFGNQIVWVQPLEEIVKDLNIDHALVKKHLSWRNDDDFKNWKLKPYPYQKVGSHFMADRGRAAVFDGVGLGKTIQILGTCQILFNRGQAKRALIVTLNPLKRQWAKEVEKFMGEPAIAVTGDQAKRLRLIKGFASRKDIRFLIVNYESLRNEKYMKEIKKIPFDIVALDEAQKIKTGVEDKVLGLKPSQNAASAYELKHIPYRFIATATPIQGKPTEIWSLFHFLDENILGSWEHFRERYCKYHPRYGVTGSMNDGELYYRIAPYFIRRTKEMPEIQQQLPKVKHDHVFLEMSDGQIKIQDYLMEKIETLKEESKNIGPNGKVINGMLLNQDQAREYYDGMIQGYTTFLLVNCDSPELFKLSDSHMAHRTLEEANVSEKEISKSPKLDYFLDFYHQVMHDEPNSKIVVFSQFERMVQLIHKHIPTNSVVYHGQLSEREREWAVEKFRNDPNCKVFISTDAGSTGLNLQVANYMVHIDMPWDPTLIEQRNGRIDRTGNPHPNITIMYLVMSDGYDEHLIEILQRKAEMAQNILEGGKMKARNQDFTRLALERMLKNQAKRTRQKISV